MRKIHPVWQPISRFKGDDTERVTLWLAISASPMSFGMGDSFAVADCWRDGDGTWMHTYKGAPAELRREYVTHFAPAGAVPIAGPDGSDLDWWRG